MRNAPAYETGLPTASRNRDAGGEAAMRDHWERNYTARAAGGMSWFQEEAQPSLDLVAAAAGTPDRAVIDVGGGASRLADQLLARGFSDLTVLDLSEAALAVARDRLGDRARQVHWLAEDATRWTPARTFHVWHDRAAFHFLVTADDRAAYLACLRDAVPPGGHAVIGTFAADGPDQCSGLPVRRYDAGLLAETFGDGFQLTHARRHMHLTPGGRPQPFQFCVFRRTDAGAARGT